MIKILKNKPVAIFLIVVLLLAFTWVIVKSFQDIGENMAQNPKVEIETSEGKIVIELYKKEAPITVDNFISYVNEGHYDNTVFHRVIDGFMIQGGGFTEDGTEKKTKPPIKLESNNGLKNEEGTIAMARTMVPDSATSQFFINTANNDFLNYGSRDEGYAVFGKVIEGMDVVKKIESVQTTTKKGMDDWPVDEVKIIKARII